MSDVTIIKNKNLVLTGLYILMFLYFFVAIYLLLVLNNFLVFIFIAIVAYLYERIIKSVKKEKKSSWFSLALILLFINILDGVSTLLNVSLFKESMPMVAFLFRMTTFVVSSIILVPLFKIRKSLNK